MDERVQFADQSRREDSKKLAAVIDFTRHDRDQYSHECLNGRAQLGPHVLYQITPRPLQDCYLPHPLSHDNDAVHVWSRSRYQAALFCQRIAYSLSRCPQCCYEAREGGLHKGSSTPNRVQNGESLIVWCVSRSEKGMIGTRM